MKNNFIKCIFFFFGFFCYGFAQPYLHIQHWQLKTQTPVYFVHAKQVPMVDIIVAFRAGSNRDQKHFGLANLTGQLLGQATSKFDSNQIADKMDALGMVFNVKTNRDMTIVHLRSMSDPKYLNPALKLFIKILSDAKFSKSNLHRVKNNILQAIATDQQNPSQVANDALANLIFANTAYAHPSFGTLKTVKNLTTKNIEHFYERYYVAKNAMIVIVGDITGFQAKAIAANITNNLPKGKLAAKSSLVKNNQPQEKHIDFPANQTSIRIGEVGVSPKLTIQPALVIGNYILGQGLTSLLFKTVREKYGLTYSIGSYFLPLTGRGAFVIGLQTQNQQTQKAVTLTKKVVKNFLNEGPTAQQLQAAKQFLLGNFPLRFDSNEKIAKYVLKIAFYHLPLDYLQNFTHKVKTVTAKQVKAAMQKAINPKNFVVVTVGGNA